MVVSASYVDAFSPSLTSSAAPPLPLHYLRVPKTTTTTAAASLTSYFRRKRSSNLILHSSQVTFAEILDNKSDQDSSSPVAVFDPFHCSHVGWNAYDSKVGDIIGEKDCSPTTTLSSSLTRTTPILALSTTLLINPQPAFANGAINKLISEGDFNPDSFRPICSNSDAFYRLLQSSTRSIVGDDNFVEYGPLIAGGLLRIRLELCVVESFFNEAVGPFIQQNGLNWILPLHESVETFLAGTIFALATTFILVSSTKVIQILAFYGDLLIGGPCRLFGGFFFDRARGEPVTLDVSFFGFFKTRLVGPPIDFEEEKKLKRMNGDEKGKGPLFDLEKVKPMDVPLLALSGSVKVVGEASKVSGILMFIQYRCPYLVIYKPHRFAYQIHFLNEDISRIHRGA